MIIYTNLYNLTNYFNSLNNRYVKYNCKPEGDIKCLRRLTGCIYLPKYIIGDFQNGNKFDFDHTISENRQFEARKYL